jgi:hypothetical protein
MPHVCQLDGIGIVLILIFVLTDFGQAGSLIIGASGFCPVEYCGTRPYGTIIEFEKVVYEPSDTITIVIADLRRSAMALVGNPYLLQ